LPIYDRLNIWTISALIQDSFVTETKVRGLKILVVDSDYDFLQVLTQFLNKEGHEVITAYDGEEGLNKALVESPDLVILEPMLSKIHGFTLCGMISGEFKKDIPVIIISQHYTDENFKKEALRTHGASAYMVRPITKSELRAVMDDVLKTKPDAASTEEREHPDLISDIAYEAPQPQKQAETDAKVKHESQKTKTVDKHVNIEELLAAEGIIVKKPEIAQQTPPAGNENGAMKKIGAILTTEISFNKIRERLRSAVENEEISSQNYKERIIPRTTQNGSRLEAKERADATNGHDIEQQSAENNNGNEPKKQVKVDEMLNDIMDEFGLSGTSTGHRTKPSL